jgi:NHL repeat
VNVGAHRSLLRSVVGLWGVLAPGRGGAGECVLRRTSTALALGMVTVFACALQGALCAGVVQAEPPKLVSYGQFASEGPGVAVDQASGDVFTAGFFDVEYKITSKGQEGSNVKSFGHIEKLDAEGKRLSTFGPEGLYGGAVVNPVNGNLYVLEAFSFATGAQGIAVYGPGTGAFVRSFPVPSYRDFAGSFSIVQIASDSSGNVYVPGENDILEYSEAGTLLKTFTGAGAGALKEPTGVAIDSSGNLWVADYGNRRIVELDSSGARVEVNGKPVEIESEGVFSAALDGHGDVFATVDDSADPCGAMGASSCVHLVEYSAGGRQLADVGAGAFGTPGPSVHLTIMVAVNEASGRVYVDDLPKQLPSRLTTLQKACPDSTFNANPAGCPADSRVGHAKAITPLIPVPLEGPAYFVSHGGAKFPELIVLLQGYGVTLDLHGETFISKAGITSSTFHTVPDAPVGSFELTLPGGPFSALAANGNLCSATTTILVKKRVEVRSSGHTRTVTRKVRNTITGLVMPTAFTAQNGAVIHENTPIKVTGCGRAKKSAHQPNHKKSA